ncbi:hypothetical protein BpHYR1_005356 [Brachionus plicatilis]|uniref:Uncharacterized protein n=1 Tax=Brachionus plicatilis TaxID=10195 RepID=A0A3M7R444_BRAPC|nr:hypothetical protein BpHYR1_005356 [Brachionus plicatilis]
MKDALIVGLTERLNKYEFPSNVKAITLGQKRKPGRPKTTVECLEFQPGEQVRDGQYYSRNTAVVLIRASINYFELENNSYVKKVFLYIHIYFNLNDKIRSLTAQNISQNLNKSIKKTNFFKLYKIKPY